MTYDINVGDIIKLNDSTTIVITYVDLQKLEGAIKLYGSIQEANEHRHTISLQQLPEWHKTNCKKCKEVN